MSNIQNFIVAVEKNWFPCAIALVVLFGYQFGKDIAERHNTIDQNIGAQDAD